MKTVSNILNRFTKMKITTLAAIGAAALLSTPAHAFDTDNDGDDFHFDLIRSVGLTPFPTVAPNAHGKVKIESVGPVEIMKVKVWFVARFNIETFIVAPGVAPAPADPFHDPNRRPDATQNPTTNLVQIYHIGLWFTWPCFGAATRPGVGASKSVPADTKVNDRNIC